MANGTPSTITPGALPTLTDEEFTQQLLTGLVETRTQITDVLGGGKHILKMPEGGVWTFGQENVEVQEGSHWCINVKTIGWGWCVWTEEGGKNKKHAVVNSVLQPLPQRPMPIQGKAFSNYFSFDLVCLDGEDAGVEVTYGANTVGIAKAFPKLRDAIIAQIQRDPKHPCPVVTLSSEDYRNSYGQQYNPVFTITGWADLGGNLAPTGTSPKPQVPPPTAAAPAEPAAPARKRKAPLGDPGPLTSSAQVEAAQADPGPAPVSTQQAHTGQRRRHRPAA